MGGHHHHLKKLLQSTDESKNNARTLQKRTVEKWNNTFKYDGEAWLIVNKDQSNTDLVASFNCRICRQFEDQINLIKGFKHTWIKEGSKRLLLNTAKEYAESKPQKKDFDLCLQDTGLTVRKRSKTTYHNA